MSVVAKANFELSTLLSNLTRGASKAGMSGSSRPLFSESMLAASDAMSQGRRSTDGSPNVTRRPRSASEDEKAPGTATGVHADVSPIACQQVTASQADSSQHALLLFPNVMPKPSSGAEGSGSPNTTIDVANSSVGSLVAPTPSGVEFDIAQSRVVLSADSGPQRNQAQGATGQGHDSSILPNFTQGLNASAMPSPPTDSSLSIGAATIPSNTTQQAPSDTLPYLAQTVQNALTDNPLIVFPSRAKVLDAAGALPNPPAMPNKAVDTPIIAANSSIGSFRAFNPSGIELGIAQSRIGLSVGLGTQRNRVEGENGKDLDSLKLENSALGINGSVIPSLPTKDSLASGVTTSPLSTAQQTALKALPNPAPFAVRNAVTNNNLLNTSPSGVQILDAAGALPNPTALQNAAAAISDKALLNSVLSAIHNGDSNTVQKPAPDLISTSLSSAPSSTVPLAVPLANVNATENGKSASTLGNIPTDLVISHAGAVPDATVAKGRDGSQDGASGAKGLKQTPHLTSSQFGSQPSSREVTQSGNQSQGGTSSQGQGTAPAQTNLANQADSAISHAQATAIGSLVQTPLTPASLAGHIKNAPAYAAPATVFVPQALPVINTAKLIQSMGQSEMRVGMHSTEFGNISINTSASRDLISAQISLDHGELAKVLAAHLPEMQTRLGGDQTVNVRIDNNSVLADHSAGTSGGTSNGSTGESRGGKHQSGSATSGYRISGRAFPSLASITTRRDGGQPSRLDVRV